MSTRAASTFVIDSWDEQQLYDEPGARVVRTHLTKTFAGDITGTSVGDMTMAHATGDSAAYVGFERFTATVHGRAGTFLLMHQAWGDAAGGAATWQVVGGSGTGALAGLTGRGEIVQHDDGSHSFALEYDLG